MTAWLNKSIIEKGNWRGRMCFMCVQCLLACFFVRKGEWYNLGHLCVRLPLLSLLPTPLSSRSRGASLLWGGVHLSRPLWVRGNTGFIWSWVASWLAGWLGCDYTCWTILCTAGLLLLSPPPPPSEKPKTGWVWLDWKECRRAFCATVLFCANGKELKYHKGGWGEREWTLCTKRMGGFAQACMQKKRQPFVIHSLLLKLKYTNGDNSRRRGWGSHLKGNQKKQTTGPSAALRISISTWEKKKKTSSLSLRRGAGPPPPTPWPPAPAAAKT